MDETEKKLIAEMYRRRQEAEPIIEADKLKREKDMPLTEALAQFDSSFRYSLTLPPRESSGLVEFYRKLSRLR